MCGLICNRAIRFASENVRIASVRYLAACLLAACTFPGSSADDGNNSSDAAPVVDAATADGDIVADADPGCEDDEDEDGDGLGNRCDNCPSWSNGDQSDVDQDGVGDRCDPANDVNHTIIFADFFNGTTMAGWTVPETPGAVVADGWSEIGGALVQSSTSDEIRIVERAELDLDDAVIELTYRVPSYNDGVSLNIVGTVSRYDGSVSNGGEGRGYSCNQAKFNVQGDAGREYMTSAGPLNNGVTIRVHGGGIEPTPVYREVMTHSGTSHTCRRFVNDTGSDDVSFNNVAIASGSVGIRTIATSVEFLSIVVYVEQ